MRLGSDNNLLDNDVRVMVVTDLASLRQESLRQDSLRHRLAYRAPGFERLCAHNRRKTH